MGSGKTSYAIQKMIEDTKNNYIYITPFLTEVQRIKDNCRDRKFYEPINKGLGKLDSLHKLLLENKNIASTHALFKMSNDITKDLIKSNNYVLILDEVMDVIEEVPLKKDDLKILKETELITIREDGLVLWNEDKLDYQTQYDDIKTMCTNNSLFMVNNVLLMWTFPVDIFKSFKEVYVMSYLFDAQIQRYYYDLYKLEYTYYYVFKENDKYILKLKDNTYKENKSLIKNNINILEDTINSIGEKDYSLSVSWYEKDKNKVLINQLKNNLYNYFQNKTHAKAKDLIWTTYRKYEKKLIGKGYSKGFIPVNSRATNLYSDRHNLAYCVNIFLNPIIKQFFTDRNIVVKEDTYALSEMIQWIWRSAIRNNEKVNIYVPSARMRNLLIEWLNN
jgi:hypothetical protein